ncbi:MAG: tRNA (adenosine(37)-N6)-dimethylallyltransferase MiaA [Patescibacteria group bacterium]
MSNQFSKSKIIVILGQTASGKSELAVKIAKKFNGEIISADSRQVYKGLNLGSGKITKKEMQGIKHHLLDVVSPKRVFTVARYQKLAKKAIKKILKKGKMPIICGGTGLYIDALIYDWQLPEIPPQPKLRKELEKRTTKELFKKLKKLDSRRAKNIDKNNRRRLIRALEIVLITGKPVSSFQKISSYDVLLIGIKKSPEELKKLIKKRLLKRLKRGMIKEVKNLHEKQKLSWQRLDDFGLEYRYVSRFLRQRAQISADRTQKNVEKKQAVQKLINEMIETIEKESWQYAKRQITWFKRNKNIYWISETDEAIKSVEIFLSQSIKL